MLSDFSLPGRHKKADSAKSLNNLIPGSMTGLHVHLFNNNVADFAEAKQTKNQLKKGNYHAFI